MSPTTSPSPRPENAPGFFLVFEGGDGSGKSTQARAVASVLEGSGFTVTLTREPGGTPIAEALRSLVLDPAHAPVDPRTEALLYATARSSHVHQVILPALARGEVVVCDRFVDSSLAYQGEARDLGVDAVARLNAFGTEGLVPDLTVVLDAPTALGRTRRGLRDGTEDRLEAEPDAFHQRVRDVFVDLAAQAPGRYLVLDAARPPEEITTAVLQALHARLAPPGDEAADAVGTAAAPATDTTDTSGADS